MFTVNSRVHNFYRKPIFSDGIIATVEDKVTFDDILKAYRSPNLDRQTRKVLEALLHVGAHSRKHIQKHLATNRSFVPYFDSIDFALPNLSSTEIQSHGSGVLVSKLEVYTVTSPRVWKLYLFGSEKLEIKLAPTKFLFEVTSGKQELIDNLKEANVSAEDAEWEQLNLWLSHFSLTGDEKRKKYYSIFEKHGATATEESYIKWLATEEQYKAAIEEHNTSQKAELLQIVQKFSRDRVLINLFVDAMKDKFDADISPNYSDVFTACGIELTEHRYLQHQVDLIFIVQKQRYIEQQANAYQKIFTCIPADAPQARNIVNELLLLMVEREDISGKLHATMQKIGIISTKEQCVQATASRKKYKLEGALSGDMDGYYILFEGQDWPNCEYLFTLINPVIMNN